MSHHATTFLSPGKHAKHIARLIVCAAFFAGRAICSAEDAPAEPPADDHLLRSTPSSSPSASAPTVTRPTVTTGPSATAQTAAPPRDEDIVDKAYESLSSRLLSTATWLDSFFGNERYQAEANESEFRVRFDAFREGDTKTEFLKPDYSLRLVLPQLRKKTHLLISGDARDVDTATAQPGTPAAQPQPVSGRNVAGAIQYFPVETDRSSFSIRAGAKLHYTKLSVQVGPRYRYLLPLVPWDLRLTQEVIWSSEQKWISRTTVDLERKLPGGLFFRTSLDGTWAETVKGYPYSLSFVLSQPLDPFRALTYSWISSFQTSPTDELVQELFAVGYRQRIWKPWLFLEIDPQVRYPRDRGFAYTPGILFRLEMVFGRPGALF